MPAIHVCPLSQIETIVTRCGASHLVSLINLGTPVARPAGIAADRHLFLGFNDIAEPQDGLTPPGEDHVEQLLAFAGGWDRARPLVIHCYAGISRSTAGAFVTLCGLFPAAEEQAIARALRAASPSATPNPRLVALADRLLGRDGRMVAAIENIGRGTLAFEGEPFAIEVAAFA